MCSVLEKECSFSRNKLPRCNGRRHSLLILGHSTLSVSFLIFLLSPGVLQPSYPNNLQSSILKSIKFLEHCICILTCYKFIIYGQMILCNVSKFLNNTKRTDVINETW